MIVNISVHFPKQPLEQNEICASGLLLFQSKSSQAQTELHDLKGEKKAHGETGFKDSLVLRPAALISL